MATPLLNVSNRLRWLGTCVGPIADISERVALAIDPRSRVQAQPPAVAAKLLPCDRRAENLSVVGTAEKQFQYPIGDGGVSARNVRIRRVRTQGPTDGLYFTGPQSTVVCEDSNLDSRWDTVFLRDGSKALLRRCELRSLGPNAIHPHQHGLAQCLAGSILRLEDCAARMRASNSDRDRKLTGIRAADGGRVELVNSALDVEVLDWQSRWDLLAETGEIAVSGGSIDRKRCRGNVVWAG